MFTNKRAELGSRGPVVRLVVKAVVVIAASVLPLTTLGATPALAAPEPAGAVPTFVAQVSRVTGTLSVVHLSASECAAINAVSDEAAPTCTLIDHTTVTHGNTAGSRVTALAGSSYWYWSASDELCAIYGCWYWNINLQEDGVANGTHVYQWNVYCTASGYGVSVTWCGYSNNGGGWPYYDMTFGANFNACVGPYSIGCFSHGMRRVINDWGNPINFYAW